MSDRAGSVRDWWPGWSQLLFYLAVFDALLWAFDGITARSPFFGVGALGWLLVAIVIALIIEVER